MNGDGALPELEAAFLDLFAAIPAEVVVGEGQAIEAVDPGESLQVAASRMWWRSLGALPVLEDGALVGSLSEDDLLRVCAERALELKDDVEEYGRELLVWDTLLAGLDVRSAMTPRVDLPVVQLGTPLLSGVERCFSLTPAGTRNRYVMVVDEDDQLVRLISFRDVARYLIALFDRRFDVLGPAPQGLLERAARQVRGVMDLSIGAVRDHGGLGHPPVLAPFDASGEVTVQRMWEGHRGYVIVTFADGAPLGICTRRDLLRALRSPFLKLEGLRVASLMSHGVVTVSRLDTLVGLFKRMAIEGCRHMPVLDDQGRVECVISMWEAVALLARPQGARP